MSDPLLKKAEDLSKELVERATTELSTLKKIKAMTKILKSMDEDTKDIEKFTDVSETLLKDIVDKLGPNNKK